jgi:cell division topological specificity factor
MGFLKFFTRDEITSKDIAKERLRLILVNDRANVSPKFLDMIKSELVDMISDYMEIEEDGLEVKLTKIDDGTSKNVPALVANVPIKKVKHLANF